MSQKNPSSRVEIDKSGWAYGCDSYSSPLLPRDGYARWAVNAANKGGVWQTRPGFVTRMLFDVTDTASNFYAWWLAAGLPTIYPQGMDWFVPTNGKPYLVFAVSGSVWASQIDPNGRLEAAFQIGGAAFSASAAQVTFCRTVQTQTIVDGVVEDCAARNILIMQDGGSRACYWDGVTSGSLNPQKSVTVDGSGNTLFNAGFNQTRIGQWMAWSGNRLFVGLGPQVWASDLGDPLYFTEELTLTSVPVINLGEAVTGLSDRGTSGNVNSQCLIFTAHEVYAVYSGVQQRIPDSAAGYPGWQGTPNFLSKIFAGTGCVAGKTIVNHRGLIYWLSAGGIVMFDSINNVTSSQNMPAINTEEAYSNVLLGTNQVLACAGFYNSFVLWSMGAGVSNGGVLGNQQTQVLDRQPLPQTADETFAWQGVWTGVNPVQWATLNVYGLTRAYCLSFDAGGVVRIYEGFQANRADNGAQIPWSVETPLHLMEGGIFGRANFLYSRIFLQNLYGDLDMVWFWKGTRGTWHEILTKTVTATPGGLLADNALLPTYAPGTTNRKALTFLPQVRDILSRNQRGPEDGCSSSKVEADGLAEDGSDRAFAMQFQFAGRGALTAYRIAADDCTQDTEGAVSDSETGFHILPGEGCPELIED